MKTLVCPSCGGAVELKPIDELHSAASLTKPITNNFHGTIVQQRVKCKNKKCRSKLIVYWYAPLDYFGRI
jgi:hypothetical protein